MTPSGDHYKIAKEFIENNIHIICDKPLTASIEDAEKLQKLVKKKKIVFALTHNYSAYPMLREAKQIVESGRIGEILLVNVEYPQGYTVGIKKKDELSALKWRLNKKMCGPSMILAEIGTHSYHLLRYVTGLEAKEVSAEINSLSPELSVDDNAFLTLRMQNKARASIWVSSAATGGENGLKIRAYGTKGAVEWFQDEPNQLKFTPLNKSSRIVTRANNEVSRFSLESSRLAAGHPEGFFEAFANIYTEFADAITSSKKNNYSFPEIEDGVKGIKFIFAAKNSSNKNSRWIKL
jgi:predicted dehydrogenase